MPSSSALAAAPSRILTKNGLVSVLVMMQADVPSCANAGAASVVASAAAPSRLALRVMVMSGSPSLEILTPGRGFVS